MKKKIVYGLAIFALMFFSGGVYIVMTTQETIYELHRLSQLHRTVALRKDLLLSIKKNQDSLLLRKRNSHFSLEQGPDDQNMMALVETCFVCHASTPLRGEIENLKKQLEGYGILTGAVFNEEPGSALADKRTGAALAIGVNLIRRMEGIIQVTSTNLEKQERSILKGINEKKALLFILVTIGPFFTVGLAFFLVRGLTRPLNSLLDATRRLKSGDLEYRIGELDDEFGEVASSFNEMAASLKAQLLEMQRTEQLRVCGEMAAGLAHEIRNPLAGMKVSIEVLLSELDLEAQDKEVLTKMIEQIRHLELLMKNLLNYARPSAAQPTNVDINKILDKTVYFTEKHPSFTTATPKKQLVRNFDQHLPEIVCDPQKIQQVFLNILLNAAEAIPEGGKITVGTSLDPNAKSVVIEISDTGKGIPAELIEKIFQPFFTTKGKGTGLGLAVSKRIVEENGGLIAVSSNPSGGVTFRITLPVQPPDPRLTS